MFQVLAIAFEVAARFVFRDRLDVEAGAIRDHRLERNCAVGDGGFELPLIALKEARPVVSFEKQVADEVVGSGDSPQTCRDVLAELVEGDARFAAAFVDQQAIDANIFK